jgi:hypothetical protein
VKLFNEVGFKFDQVEQEHLANWNQQAENPVQTA